MNFFIAYDNIMFFVIYGRKQEVYDSLKIIVAYGLWNYMIYDDTTRNSYIIYDAWSIRFLPL